MDRADTNFGKTHQLIGLLAIHASGKTRIRVCDGTHINNGKKPTRITIVELDKYQYFIGHPFILHSGFGGVEYNVRLHFYHGFPPKVAEQTDHVPDQESIFLTKAEIHNQQVAASNVAAVKRRKRISSYAIKNSPFIKRPKH